MESRRHRWIGMARVFKAAASAFAILGCAVVVMLGTLTAYFGFEVMEQPFGTVLVAGGAFVALLGGLSLHLLLRSRRREEVVEDEGW
jgi:hypothetical protein